MNSSTISWLLIFSILFTSWSLNSFFCTATQPSYADLCYSLVPESTTKIYEPSLLPFFRFETGYYSGGNGILSRNLYDSHSLTFQPQSVFTTENDGVLSVTGTLVFPTLSTYYYVGNGSTSQYRSGVLRWRNSISFRLRGFWSESSGNLCMVGTGYTYNSQGKILNLEAVIKLSNLKNSSSTITTLVSGTMESLSSINEESYFEPISIMIFPRMKYEYTVVSEEFGDEFSGGNDSVKTFPITSLPSKSFCSIISRVVDEFNLRYTSDCDSAKNCGPFSSAVGYLPTVVSFKRIDCLEEEKRMRLHVQFLKRGYGGFYQPFNLKAALVGEGLWDDKINQLRIVACRFLNTTEPLATVQIGDCTTRMRLGFPAFWSIRETSSLVGRIWSNKPVNDSAYFNKILFQSSENPFRTFPSLKYDYTEINKVRSSCWPGGKPKKNKGKIYPNGYSNDMQFDMRVKNSKINTSWGAATPLSVGDNFYQQYSYPMRNSNSRISKSAVQANLKDNSPINISYIIDINIRYERVKLSAEGIYDPEIGQLCMVGCRHFVSKKYLLLNDSIDCEILLNFQFPPSNPKKNEGYIKGSIKSTRVVSDPLYFGPFDVSSVYTSGVVRESIVRMDLEITIAVLTNTLACVFLGLQLFHVKKHPDVLPFISLVMLSILTLGHMIPLVLDFEALFLQNREQLTVLLGCGGWLEVNGVLVRMINIVAFLFEFRLLQLSWSARSAGTNQVGLWFNEMSTLFVCLPLYGAGAFMLFLVNWRKHKHDAMSLSFRLINRHHSLWQDLKSYAGLVMDGFLLPQILLNVFRNSKENALSCPFYIGTAVVRLLPHAYDLYRAHSYNPVGSYLYAIPNSDFYSTTWDVIIPLGGLLFAAIIFLQQWFGGRCIIPGKFREDEAYERVPVSESQLAEKSSTCEVTNLATAGSDPDGDK